MKKLICNKTFDKKQIVKLIEWFIYNYGAIRTSRLIEKLKFIGFKYATQAGLSLGSSDLEIPMTKEKLIKETIKSLKKETKKFQLGNITKNALLEKEIEMWSITNNILKNEIVKTFRQKNLLNTVYMMSSSGARGNITQIKQIIGMRGLMSNSKGEIINIPIKSNLKEGLKSKEYFISCYGARKGIIDTALKTANSGYLTRKLIYVAQSIIIKQPDCGTKNGILVKLSRKNKSDYKRSIEKIIGTVCCENLTDKKRKTIIAKGQDIPLYIAKKIIQTEPYIIIRSVLNCKINVGVCQLCYGWNLAQNKLVKLGEAVGILAAQSIGEPGTQLTMRTFHTGGIFTSKTNKVITSPHKGKIIYNYSKESLKLKNKYGEHSFYLLRKKNIYIKKNRIILSRIALPEFSTVYLKSNKKVFKGQIIAEITEPNKQIKSQKVKVITEVKSKNSGQIYIKTSKKEKKKLIILEGNVLQYKSLLKNSKKNVTVMNIFKKINVEKTQSYTKRNGILLINYKKTNIFKDKIRINKTKQYYEIKAIDNEQKEFLIIKNERKINSKSKNKKTKIGEIYNKINGKLLEIRSNIIKLRRLFNYLITNNSRLVVSQEELIQKNKTIINTLNEKDKTEDIIEGLPKVEKILEAKKISSSKNIHQKIEKLFSQNSKFYNNKLANRKSIGRLQNLLVKQVQDVYLSQNVDIAEKHIAIIVKQITSKVIIMNKGDSNIIEGELVNINKIEKLNKTLQIKAIYQPVLLGISKTSLLSNGFISAACFQETIRIFSKSAIKAQIDWLTGLKENIIFGNLIQVGTGKNTMV